MDAGSSRHPFRCAGDRGGVVLGWLVRLVVGLGVAGVVVVDGVSVLAARLQVADQAAGAAREAVRAGMEHPVDRAGAHAAAAAAAAAANPRNAVPAGRFRLLPDGTVELTVERTATTVLLHRLGPLGGWTDVAAAATSRPATEAGAGRVERGRPAPARAAGA